jgi:hypothetical protein
MTLQDIVTSQETSRKLKEAGFSQEGGIAYWIRDNFNGEWKFQEGKDYEGTIPRARAFSFNELWELLPKKINWDYMGLRRDRKGNRIKQEDTFYLICNAIENEWGYWSFIQEVWLIHFKGNPQEAAAELALWCVKEKYLDC